MVSVYLHKQDGEVYVHLVSDHTVVHLYKGDGGPVTFTVEPFTERESGWTEINLMEGIPTRIDALLESAGEEQGRKELVGFLGKIPPSAILLFWTRVMVQATIQLLADTRSGSGT